MDEKGIMGVPITIAMALVIGVMCMGVLMQFVGTAERTVLKDMRVTFSTSDNRLTVKVYDSQSGDALGGATAVVKYPGGMDAHTRGLNSNRYTSTIPVERGAYVVANVRGTHSGYVPREGEVAVHQTG